MKSTLPSSRTIPARLWSRPNVTRSMRGRLGRGRVRKYACSEGLNTHLWVTAATTCPFLPVSGCPSARNFSVRPRRMAVLVLSASICSREECQKLYSAPILIIHPAACHGDSPFCSFMPCPLCDAKAAHGLSKCYPPVSSANSEAFQNQATTVTCFQSSFVPGSKPGTQYWQVICEMRGLYT